VNGSLLLTPRFTTGKFIDCFDLPQLADTLPKMGGLASLYKTGLADAGCARISRFGAINAFCRAFL
jgi:hypothetical protein